MTLTRMDPPSGRDSLELRRAYFRKRRSRRLGYHRLTRVWVIVGAVFFCLFLAGFTGLVH